MGLIDSPFADSCEISGGAVDQFESYWIRYYQVILSFLQLHFAN